MGSGSWTSASVSNYVSTSRGISYDDFVNSSMSAQEVYRAHKLDEALDPHNVMRECCDSEEHPNTLPVILALDVTGSMGSAAVAVAQKLGEIMTDLYADDSVQDIEFCIMGIGDLAYDGAPIQMSQFESDVRIMEQLDKIYFEHGGGGNSYESYTVAWYMGINNCKLDCWSRGQKGIIITLGDELPNPHLPGAEVIRITGNKLQGGDIETKELYKEVIDKYDVYHISVDDSDSSYQYNNKRFNLDKNWSELIGSENYFVASLNNLSKTIVDIIANRNAKKYAVFGADLNNNNEISW